MLSFAKEDVQEAPQVERTVSALSDLLKQSTPQESGANEAPSKSKSAKEFGQGVGDFVLPASRTRIIGGREFSLGLINDLAGERHVRKEDALARSMASAGLPASLKVFLPQGELQVEIRKSCTVRELLLCILLGSFEEAQKVAELDGSAKSGRQAKLEAQLHTICLVAASDEGEVDGDCPSLDTNMPVHVFGIQHFLVQKLGAKSTKNFVDFDLVLPKSPMVIGQADSGAAPLEPNIALHDAAEHGFLQEIRWLLKQKLVGVDDTLTGGWTALHLASRAGNLPVVNFLLKNGANLDAATDEGKYTPLHLSCWNGHESVVEILLTCGVDVEAKDADGHTAMYLARAARHSGISSLLLSEQGNR